MAKLLKQNLFTTALLNRVPNWNHFLKVAPQLTHVRVILICDS